MTAGEVWVWYFRILPYLVVIDVVAYGALFIWAWRRRSTLPRLVIKGLPLVTVVSVICLFLMPSPFRAASAWVVLTALGLSRSPYDASGRRVHAVAS